MAWITPSIGVSKRKLLINGFLKLNLATHHMYGCVIVVWIIELVDCIKNVLKLFNDKTSFADLLAKKWIWHHTHNKFTGFCHWNV